MQRRQLALGNRGGAGWRRRVTAAAPSGGDLSRPQLEDDVDRVWATCRNRLDPASSASCRTRTVPSGASALRRKLGDSARNLQTVRGAGYRFTAPS